MREGGRAMDIAAMEAYTYREEARWGRSWRSWVLGASRCLHAPEHVCSRACDAYWLAGWQVLLCFLGAVLSSPLFPLPWPCRSIPDADWAGLLAVRSSSGGGSSGGSGFQAVLINTGWECEGRGDTAVQVGAVMG